MIEMRDRKTAGPLTHERVYDLFYLTTLDEERASAAQAWFILDQAKKGFKLEI